MGILDGILNSVKSNLEWRVDQSISSGISSGVSKVLGDGERRAKCPKCKKPLKEENLKFCPECGAKIMFSCKKCSMDFPLGTKFCTSCGGKLA